MPDVHGEKQRTDLEGFVAKYGEEYRALITNALQWLDEQEPKWGLARPLGRKSFIAGLVRKAKPMRNRQEAPHA